MTCAALDHGDVQRLMACVRDVYTCDLPDHLPQRFLEAVSTLIGCDYRSYNALGSHGRASLVAPTSYITPAAERLPMFMAFLREHPLLVHWNSHPANQALRWSDLACAHGFEGTHLFQEYYWPMGTRSQLTLPLTEPGLPGVMALCFNRSHGDFSDRDVALLDLLRPHFIQARHNARLLAAAQKPDASSHRHALHRGSIELDPSGQPRWISQEAFHLLHLAFPTPSWASLHLPDEVIRWVREARGRWEEASRLYPWKVQTPEGQLRFLFRPEPFGGATLFLTLQSAPTTPSGHTVLSSREAEVLTWIREGKRDAEIAVILDISPRTVHKHVQRILSKLGVESRTVAARQAFIQGA